MRDDTGVEAGSVGKNCWLETLEELLAGNVRFLREILCHLSKVNPGVIGYTTIARIWGLGMISPKNSHKAPYHTVLYGIHVLCGILCITKIKHEFY